MKNKLKQAYEQMTGHDLPEGLKLGLVIVPHDEVVQDPEVGDMTRPESPIPIQDIPGPADQKGVFNDLLAETAMRENGQPIQDKLGPLREGLGGVLRLTKEEIFCFISGKSEIQIGAISISTNQTLAFSEPGESTSVLIKRLSKRDGDVALVTDRDRGLFNPEFVESMKNHTVLRNANWTRIDGCPRVSDADVPNISEQQSSPFWGTTEYWFLQLCEQSECDAWVLVPHAANNQYLERLVGLCLDFVKRTERKLFVEYSNRFYDESLTQYRCLENWSNETDVSFEQIAAIRIADIFTGFDNAFTRQNLTYRRVINGDMPKLSQLMACYDDVYDKAPDYYAKEMSGYWVLEATS